jgi:putative peptidoglycan lipid II flippase
VRIVVSALYSLQDTRTPVLVAAVALSANIALSLVLMGPLKHAGLALATSVSAILNMVALVILLDRRLGPFDWDAISRSHMRVLLAAIPVAVTCVWVAGLGIWTQPEAWIAKTVMLIVGIGISVAGYVTVHALLRSDELDFLWGLLKRKLTGPPA